MLSHFKNLRFYRKRARFIQEDVAYLCAMPDYANVSRMENGLREPSLELVLLYHMLFEMPIDGLFPDIQHSVKQTIVGRIKNRITELQGIPTTSNVGLRIASLTRALARLTSL